MSTPYCLICHNIYIQTDEIATTPCGHVCHNECLADWLKTSNTCPQCRNQCTNNQVKRIYIDFVCDEDLAIARALKEITKPAMPDTDAEEMIKFLLEHIDNGSDEQQKQQQQHEREREQQQNQNDECDLCIAFQEAYDKILVEKDGIVEVLNSIERENQNLLHSNNQTSKLIEKLEMQIQANESNRQQIEEQLATSQKIVAAIQSENLCNQRTICDLKLTIAKNGIEFNDMQDQLSDLNEQLKKMSNYHAAEFQQLCHGIQYIFDGNQQRKFLKRYRDSFMPNCQTPTNDTSINDTTDINTNTCQTIVPYCGDIDSWDYIMVPLIKKS